MDKIGFGGDGESKKLEKRRTSLMDDLLRGRAVRPFIILDLAAEFFLALYVRMTITINIRKLFKRFIFPIIF